MFGSALRVSVGGLGYFASHLVFVSVMVVWLVGDQLGVF